MDKFSLKNLLRKMIENVLVNFLAEIFTKTPSSNQARSGRAKALYRVWNHLKLTYLLFDDLKFSASLQKGGEKVLGYIVKRLSVHGGCLGN